VEIKGLETKIGEREKEKEREREREKELGGGKELPRWPWPIQT
jgi:hypothetical protein